MDLQAQLLGRKTKLASVTTKVDQGLAQKSSTQQTNLVDEWAAEQGLKSREDILKAREKFFDTSLDLISAVLKSEAIIPTYSRDLNETEVRLLLGNWGNSSASSSVLFADLAAFVNGIIQQVDGGRVFVKLGSRSAKDITWTHEKTLRLYHQALASSKGTLTPSQKLELLYRAQIDCLSVSSFQEALDLLLDSSRVLFDLQLSIMVPSDTRMSLVVRPWLNIPLYCEWRAFMCDGKLRGISQYFTDLYFDDLKTSANQIRTRILKFFESEVRDNLMEKMNLQSCVIDFVADVDGPVRVLEVNQFSDSTGPGLFNWHKDREVLTKGEECPIRIREAPVDVLAVQIPQEWRDLISETP